MSPPQKSKSVMPEEYSERLASQAAQNGGVPGHLSPHCAGLEWTQGSLNDSSYRAFTKFGGKLFNAHPPSAVLKEVAALIEAAGDTPDKGKLIEQFASAFAFVAHERACEALGAPELRAQRVEGSRSQGKWPEPEPTLIESIAKEYAKHTLAWWKLRSASARTSAARIAFGGPPSPGDFLQRLFPAGSFVCFGLRQDVHYINKLGPTLYEHAKSAQFVVPNPAAHEFIVLPDGRRSLKCSENFPLRRFLIIEFDRERIDAEGKRSISELLDLQSALHAHLAERWKALALLVFSGNESLHGWSPCAGVDEERVIAFLRYACRLGADHALSSPSQFTRMPAGTHANGTRQSVHFFKAL
jgi:hypothetical protein